MTYLAACYYIGALVTIVILAVRAHNRMFGDDQQ